MKKVFAITLIAIMLLCMLAGCGDNAKTDGSNDSSAAADPTTVDLMGMYTVKDPEGVEYDNRVALYMPVLESDEHYADGARNLFCVFYGKDGKGVYMYSVEIFDTEEHATAYQQLAESGRVDGVALISESNADFFAAMEAFIPDLQTWIDNMKASGMIEVD